MIKLHKYYCLAFIYIFISCEHKKFTLEDLSIPPYYKSYNYKSFWKNQGYSFPNYDPALSKQKHYKDIDSKNFLAVNVNQSNIVYLEKQSRIKEFINYANDLNGSLEHGTKNGIEYYTITYNYNVGQKQLYNSDTHLIFIKDSLHISINFTSFDNPGKKYDYVALVNDILNK